MTSPQPSDLRGTLEMSTSEIDRLYDQIKELTAEVKTCNVAIGRLEERVAAQRLCPNPGSCLVIGEEVKGLKEAHAELRGMAKAWAVACAGLAVVVPPLISWLLELLKGSSKTQ